MGDGPDPYKQMGLNPNAPAKGLRRIRHGSNPKTSEDMSFEKCYECGKIIAPREVYDSKYCKDCAEKIRTAKNKSYIKCLHCGEFFSPSKLSKSKYCPKCTDKIRICKNCNKEFISDLDNLLFCSLCLDSLSKECSKCGKEFIPKKDYYHMCPSCNDKYNKRPEVNAPKNDFKSTDKIDVSSKIEEQLDVNSLIDHLDENKVRTRAINSPKNIMINEPIKDDKLFNKLIYSYESSVYKIILYCVMELPTYYSINKVIEVLRGSNSAFIRGNSLNELSTYSIFPNFLDIELKKFIKTLIKQNLLKIRHASPYNRPTLEITEKGLKFVSNEKTSKIGIFDKKTNNYVQISEKELYEKLKDLRNQIAKENKVPAYVICNNNPLFEMAQQRPADLDSMITIKGIGEGFIKNYGKQFLNLLREYESKCS